MKTETLVKSATGHANDSTLTVNLYRVDNVPAGQNYSESYFRIDSVEVDFEGNEPHVFPAKMALTYSEAIDIFYREVSRHAKWYRFDTARIVIVESILRDILSDYFDADQIHNPIQTIIERVKAGK